MLIAFGAHRCMCAMLKKKKNTLGQQVRCPATESIYLLALPDMVEIFWLWLFTCSIFPPAGGEVSMLSVSGVQFSATYYMLCIWRACFLSSRARGAAVILSILIAINDEWSFLC